MRSVSGPGIIIIGAIALSLLPAAAGADSVSGYWRQQGQTVFFCPGTKNLSECRDRTDANGYRLEMLEVVPGHATFRESGRTGGKFYTMTWRVDWAAPPYVIPGQVVQVTTKATVIGLSYEASDWPISYCVPIAAWNGYGAPDWVVYETADHKATAVGQSFSATNTTHRAKAPPGGLAAGTKTTLGISAIACGNIINASVPYVWVRGTPRRVTSAPTIVPPPESKRVFFNNNIAGVSNGGKSPTFTFDSAVRITYIMTYHWNGGRGAPAGSIALRRSDGTVHGPWHATLKAGVYWEVAPNVVLPAGRYQLIDSDPATWAQNRESGGFGMSDIRGDRQ